ncbi:MAG TPA: heme-binding protein [Methanoregula sp.]|nr:heme-binding protein [Methanoregula sp.]
MTETIAYKDSGRMGEVEIRTYPAIILATVQGLAEGEAFGILFQYISGNNKPGRAIPMTAPVITLEKIAMTAPVISNADAMSFVLPAKYPRDEVPEPLDPHISIQEISPRVLAVIRFKGRASDYDVAEVTGRLLKVLESENIPIVGKPFLMRYNSHFTPGFLRRNEVGIEIRQ